MRKFSIFLALFALAACNNNDFAVHEGWSKKEIPTIQIAFQMPSNGEVQEQIIRYKNKDFSSYLISSSENTEATDYFYFSILEITNHPETLALQYCKDGVKPHSVFETAWTKFDFYTNCSRPSYRFILGDKDYLILLPQGDWGDESENIFKDVLRSIRPI